MIVDISPILQALVGGAATVIGVGAPIFAAWLFSHLKNKEAREALTGAVTRAAAVAVDAGQKAATSFGPIDVKTNSVAVAAGLDYLNKTVPDAVQHSTPAIVSAMVAAEATKQQLAAPPTTLTTVQQQRLGA